MNDQLALREQLFALLSGGQAHMSFEDVIANFPIALINHRPPHVSYTLWHLLEHLRITQWDILEFIRNPKHISPDWPKGYWPDPTSQASPSDWANTVEAFRQDLLAMQSLVRASTTDLFATVPNGTGQTILREVLLVADHNAYHIGEMGVLRQVIEAWPT